ncbi:hypothetical protein HanXRQr2_Chr03g0118931 [Helianthus annuus]|uniref:Uncharacterized protein n=1 Tax=Helianthus annuus TaxID=4232 RepID=A0A9K3NWX7_HELAN|nr:hypothetical protein HanXRQr2_Chr03g0118931 [Helianthus annuus]KAJ0944342.1 hypothetical protein HanPSC8_Chr03g0115531 [Helianthus annuus]
MRKRDDVYRDLCEYMVRLFEKPCKIDHHRIHQTYNCLIGSSHIDNGTTIGWVSADTVPFFLCVFCLV